MSDRVRLEDCTPDELERIRARLERDVDPDVVAEGRRSREAAAKAWGTPKRCKVNECHPATGECLHCGAANGEACKLGFGG